MLIVDSREPESIARIFEEKGVATKVTALSIGDFFDEEKGVVFERKTIQDFITSITDGHLQKQLLQMNQFKHAFLMIVGAFEDSFGQPGAFSLAQFCGAIASVTIRFPSIKVVRMLTTEEMVLFIKSALNKVDDGKIASMADTELLKGKITKEDYQLGLLMLFPNVGMIKAKKYLSNPLIKSRVEEFITFFQEEGILKFKGGKQNE